VVSHDRPAKIRLPEGSTSLAVGNGTRHEERHHQEQVAWSVGLMSIALMIGGSPSGIGC
jgi:hypothetical protein